MFFKKRSFKAKLVTAVIFISLVSFINAFFILKMQERVSDEYFSISQDNLPKVSILKSMLFEFRELRIQVRSMPFSGNTKEDIQQHMHKSSAQIDKFNKLFDDLKKFPFDQKGTDFISVIELGWKDFVHFGGRMFSLYKSNNPKSLSQGEFEIRTVCPVKAKEVIGPIMNFLKYQDERLATRLELAKNKKDQTITTALIICSLFLVALITFGSFYSNKISQQISNITNSLIESSKQLVKSGESMKSTSVSLKESTQQTTKRLEQTVKNTQNVISTMGTNSDLTGQSLDLSNLTLNEAKERKQDLETLKSLMKKIESTKVNVENVDLSEISELIQQIGERTKVIQDIVFQTRLLSFNASVEAARAGEAGRGFSVVAEEISKLANTSGTASEEISSLLQHTHSQVSLILDKSKSAFDKMLNTIQDGVQKGAEKASQCDEGFSKVFSNMQSLYGLSEKLSHSNEKHAELLDHVAELIYKTEEEMNSHLKLSKQLSSSGNNVDKESECIKELASNLSSIVYGDKGAA